MVVGAALFLNKHVVEIVVGDHMLVVESGCGSERPEVVGKLGKHTHVFLFHIRKFGADDILGVEKLIVAVGVGVFFTDQRLAVRKSVGEDGIFKINYAKIC